MFNHICKLLLFNSSIAISLLAAQYTAAENIDSKTKAQSTGNLLLSEEELNVLRAGQQPVGNAPKEEDKQNSNAVNSSLEHLGSSLKGKRSLIIEPSFSFSTSSVNRFTFRGIEIIDSVLLGAIEASDVDRETFSSQISVRYGLSNKLELSLSLPYSVRSDKLSTILRNQAGEVSRTENLQGEGYGDISAGIHYQLSSGKAGSGIFIGNLSYKSTTGDGPFNVKRGPEGIETELPTGSGFEALSAALTYIYPKDPASLFIQFSHTSHRSDYINRQLGQQFIGKVDPGNSIGLNLGIGLALSPDLSLTMGFQFDSIRGTSTFINEKEFHSSRLSLGAFFLATSLQLNEKQRLNINGAFGITDDAPDMQIGFSMPYDVFK